MSTPARPRLLFVDDEPALLNGLRKVLYADWSRWDLRFAQGGAEALARLAEQPAEVVVTDMRMPDMDGLALLRCVQQGWPLAARLVLSGYADLPVVAAASAVAHQYLLKPCDADALRATVERTLALQARLGNPSLQQVVGCLGALPTAPGLQLALAQALEGPQGEGRRFAAVVEDVGASARVLQFVNSAFYGLARDVTSIEEALDLLGGGTLRLLLPTLEGAHPQAGGDEAEELKALRRHARLTAAIARRLEEDPARAELAYAVGLLHDCGKLVLFERLPGPFAEATALARRTGQPVQEVERALLGADHAALGAYLLGLWGLPSALVDAVAGHHQAERSQGGALGMAAVVGAADLLAHLVEAPGAGLPAAQADRLERLSRGRSAEWCALANQAMNALDGRQGRAP